MFGYCPFSRPIRDSLLDSPIYNKLITSYNSRIDRNQKSLSNLAGKLEKKFIPVPEEITRQIEYLSN